MVIRRDFDDNEDDDVGGGGGGRWVHRCRSRTAGGYMNMSLPWCLLLNLVVTTLFIQSYELYTMDFRGANSVNNHDNATEINRTLEIMTDDSAGASNDTNNDGITNNDNKNDNKGPQSFLPTCKSLMEDPHSPQRDGGFLTRHTVPISWIPRRDGSRELRHSMCRLHRYSAKEARQCLAGKHINFIGDSLTRYQYLSLAWFLHKDTYPPRYGRKAQHDKQGRCVFFDDQGKSACSPFDQPNVNMEGDWRGPVPANFSTFNDPWIRIMTVLGQPNDAYFGGYMESNSIRDDSSLGLTDGNIAENYFYATPPSLLDMPQDIHRVFLSFNSEIGWTDTPTPIQGFNYTGCAFSGKCDYSLELAETRLKRAGNLSFDFSQPVEEAILPDGVLRQVLPPVNISLYNRGLWGKIPKEKVEKLMPALYDWSQGEKGRCYFRSSAGRFESTRQHELDVVRRATQKSGCGFIDVAHLVEDFNSLLFNHPLPPGQEYGTVHHEFGTVYWDAVHFLPWVYEELNNMLLNVLCNNA